MQLRPYQQQAFEAVVSHIKKTSESCVLEAATGAGKSHIIAAVANFIYKASGGKRILCLAPSKELTEQNKDKYPEAASYFSASVGIKSLKNKVVFGTPQTVLNSINRFNNFCAVVVDECHEITPTIKKIIENLKEKNPNLRVIGLSATPYRMKTGYIYQLEENDKPTGHDSYFKKLVYKITAHELIEMGYLSPPVSECDLQHYDTSGIDFRDQKTIDRAFEGHGRKTSKIVYDLIERSKHRKGVLIFAQSIKHAEEVMASLPPENSRLITGKTKKSERELMLKQFKAFNFKYLVNVAVLTTGFDAPHVDVVAVLRATESASLFQQIIGRGLRLCNETNKKDCLVLDYAENIERHCPDGDIFNPEIKAYKSSSEPELIDVVCPDCGTINQFFKRPNPEGFLWNKNGYFLDLAGQETEMPAHYGRKCFGQSLINGKYKECDYRWSFKECPSCCHENDIAARRCEKCKQEIVDPNEKLRLDAKKLKRDPYALSTDKVIGWNCKKWVSRGDNETLKVDYQTECRQCTVWYMPKHRRQWDDLCYAVFGKIIESPHEFIKTIRNGEMPTSITIKKSRQTGFFNVSAHNRQIDEIPKMA